MSATNKTTHYELPSFVGSDKPAWLVDWNGAMSAIDTAIYAAKTTADGAATAASANAADILTLQGSVSTLGTDYDTLSGALTTLQGTVNTITSLIGNGEPTTTDKTIIGAINELHADITQGKPRRMIVISDSYGEVRNNNTPWTTIIGGLLNLGTDNFYTYSEGAMGYVTAGSSGHTAKTLLEAHASDISDPDDITDIVFGMGLNDYTQTASDIATAVATLVAYCKTTYPNATIWECFLANQKNKSDQFFAQYIDCINNVHAAFEPQDVKIIYGAEYIMHDFRFFAVDNAHPTTEGCTEIAKFVYNWLMGGHPVYRTKGSCEMSGAMSNFTAITEMDGSVCRISFPQNVALSDDVAFGDRNFKLVGGIESAIMRPDTEYYTWAYINPGSGYEAAIAKIKHNAVYISLPTGASGKEVVATSKIYIGDFNINTLYS